jgi:hypothetical protein
LLVNGSGFATPGAVQTVRFVQVDDPANVVDVTSFTVLNPNLIDITVLFGAANAGRTFRLRISGACGDAVEALVPVTFEANSAAQPVEPTLDERGMLILGLLVAGAGLLLLVRRR